MATQYTGKIKCGNEPNPDLLAEFAAAPFIKLINNSPNPQRAYELVMQYFDELDAEKENVKAL